MMIIIIRNHPPMTDQPVRNTEYGVTPAETMAAMAGIDFVRAIFSGKLPEPPRPSSRSTAPPSRAWS